MSRQIDMMMAALRSFAAFTHRAAATPNPNPSSGEGLPEEWTEEMPWIGQYIREDDGRVRVANSLREWAVWVEAHRTLLAHDELRRSYPAAQKTAAR